MRITFSTHWHANPAPPDPISPATWLIRVPEIFAEMEAEILGDLGAAKLKKLGREFLLIRIGDAGNHWLELGASPGGMTAELLARQSHVTALDRAPLDARLTGANGLQALCMDAAEFRPETGTVYDAILSDMNGDARESIAQVARLSANLHPAGLVVFTLKTPGVTAFGEINRLAESVAETAAAAGLRQIAITHLTYNRHEFTVFFERAA